MIDTDSLEKLRDEIRINGFMSSSQIIVKFSDKFNDIRKLIEMLECSDIKRVYYINRYAGPKNHRSLFYYSSGVTS